jgi:hypothetical protein
MLRDLAAATRLVQCPESGQRRGDVAGFDPVGHAA